MRVLSLLAVILVGLVETNASDVAKLRRLMVDSRFISIISPCKTGGTNRENAGEWVRTAFHDSASHNAAAGTGGVDASIQYETGYSENGGVAFSSTIQQYKFYQQEDVTLADIVALGAIVSVGSCGGPLIPFLHGRIDAPSAFPEGSVPHPEETTETHIERFARMGFSAAEMVELVACGHSLGGVHATVNPRITSEAHAAFDDTMDAFDNHVATGYVTDNRLNPLAQPYDPEFPERSSDARMFAHDGNVTINRLAASTETFMSTCNTVMSKMLNEAVPSSVSLSGPIVPFPVSSTFVMSLRNGAMTLTIGSARVYDMAGQWSSFEVSYTNRDGTPASPSLLTVRDMRTLSIGNPVEIRDFNIFTAIPPATGIGAIVVTLTMKDGSVYSSAEREEVHPIDDTIMIDVNNAYSCKYSGEANNNANGLNVTMAVLGPYSSGDNVDVILRTDSGSKTLVRASYMRARDEYYNYYNAFIPNLDSVGATMIGAQVTHADGSVSKDTKDDVYYKMTSFTACLAGATIPTPGPTPSGVLRRGATARLASPACPSGFALCGERCVNPMTDLEHCGGCTGLGGVDCTTLSDWGIACIAGKCVRTQEDDL